MPKINTSNLAHKYQKKTDKQHILDNPDTYIGAVEKVDEHTYVFNNSTKKIEQKTIEIVPGLYKLFDESIVNSRDHVIRMVQAMKSCKPNSIPVSYISIDINKEGIISITNDGNGIDIAEHPEHKIWIPEMIFGHLRTSTNYDKSEKKIVGGKNGFGIKLVYIWSTWGKIETVDHIRKLKYTQEFKNNLDKICKPSIVKCGTKPYTTVTFKPDYKRLGIENLTDDMLLLLQRRIYDIAAITNKTIKVKYNSELIPVKHFQHYIDLYVGDKSETKRIYEEANERWEYAVCLAPNEEFTQVSFVNGIYTGRGGKHIEYIMGQIIRKLTAYIKKKKKIDVKSNTIKEQLMLFIRCDIENPSFDSQTKDYMNTPSSKFGSTCTISDSFIERVAKMGVMDTACALTEVKENHAVKKTDGSKTKNIRGIPKLIDANFAGTNQSNECTIIFCEGDSAKAGIVSGLTTDDRNVIGVYPMKGKLFNVRGENIKRIGENKEIAEIKQILGLETGKEYTQEEVKQKLRYGKVLFMTDQDLDGSHIKGLGLNLFQSEWETLSKIHGFFGFMNTPILKAKKGKKELVFYNDGEYELWKKENDFHGWKVKYYKGLGTSTSKEFKEYFAKKKIVSFNHSGSVCSDSIDMVFNKKRADDRKLWLSKYDRGLYLNTNKKSVSFQEFIDQEMIHFSKYDCDRSIPNLVDGLKISLRKILFAAFKKRLTTEIKVAQFSGYVSEHSCYHHGEASLNGAIVGLAQNYVGSNNINLFEPNGQFGTRLQGGKDSASERYIFTVLSKLTRLIFPESDDKVLRYLDDDGTLVEPIYYTPIIPMILVNGSKGIGTGFSTDIMCYHPLQIISKIKNRLQRKSEEILIEPYYEGFKGTIIKIEKQKYLIKGCYDILSENKVRITELPIGSWTDDYKQYLEYLMDSGNGGKKGKKKNILIRDYNDMSTDTSVDITITFASCTVQDLLSDVLDHGCNALEKLLKLYTTQTTTNMHMFNGKEKLKKYESIEEIINDFYEVRLECYKKRKEYLIKALEKELVILSNKAKYIQYNLNDKIDLRRKNQAEVIKMLEDFEFDKLENDAEYKYLVKMPMDSVTSENVEKIMKETGNKSMDLETLKSTSIEKIWLKELKTLETEYKKYFEMRAKQLKMKPVKKGNKKGKGGGKGKLKLKG
jgi:DNA topoisomerase II